MGWLSRFFCRIGIHKWEWGPGYPCSACGIEDWFWKGARPGRLAVSIVTKEKKYFPDEDYLPAEWRWE